MPFVLLTISSNLHLLKSLFSYLAILICIATPFVGNSQIFHSKGFGLKMHQGYLMAHRVDMQEMEAHTKGFQFHIVNKSTGSEYWDNWYNKPEWGISLEYLDLGNEVNGKVLSLTPFIRVGSSRIRRNPRYFEIGMGIGYFDSPFHITENHLNRAIGSKLNASVRVALIQKIRLNKLLDLSMGVGITHFSNGNANLPNLGINIPNLSFGIEYFPFAIKPVPRERSTKNDFSNFEFSVGMGVKQEEVIDDERIPIFIYQGTYLFAPRKTRSYRFGIDYMIDNSYNYDFLNPATLENTSFKSKTEIALRVGHEYRLDRFSLVTDIGFYALRPTKIKKAMYQNIGLRVHANNRFYIGWHLKTHLFIADYFVYSIGYKFGY